MCRIVTLIFYLRTSCELSDFCIGVGKLIRTASSLLPMMRETPASHVETSLPCSGSCWKPSGLRCSSPSRERLPTSPLPSPSGRAGLAPGAGSLREEGALEAGQEAEGTRDEWWGVGLISECSLLCSHFAGSSLLAAAVMIDRGLHS